jgi:hypothetical protein
VTSDEQESARYLREAKARIRRRSGAYMGLLIGPFILLVTVLKLSEAHHYSAGDIRNDPLFWLAISSFFVVISMILMIGSLRILRGGPSRSADPSSSGDIRRR